MMVLAITEICNIRDKWRSWPKVLFREVMTYSWYASFWRTTVHRRVLGQICLLLDMCIWGNLLKILFPNVRNCDVKESVEELLKYTHTEISVCISVNCSFFILLSRECYRAYSKHLIISPSICFLTFGFSQVTLSSFFWHHTRFRFQQSFFFRFLLLSRGRFFTLLCFVCLSLTQAI